MIYFYLSNNFYPQSFARIFSHAVAHSFTSFLIRAYLDLEREREDKILKEVEKKKVRKSWRNKDEKGMRRINALWAIFGKGKYYGKMREKR